MKKCEYMLKYQEQTFRGIISSVTNFGVFITLAGTDFINSASQEKQINKSMQMIKMELEENLKSINQAEAAYLNEINFFRLLIQKQDSLQTIKASILENNANAPFAYENCEYSEDALEVLKSSALMQQIPDKEFILKLLQAYKGCRKINEDNKDYYKYKQDHITRYLSHQTSNNIHKNYNSIYEVWAARLQEYDIKQLILTFRNRTRNNQRSTSIVNQYRVHLIDNSIIMFTLHQILRADSHIVTQIVKTKLIVRTESNIGHICSTACVRIRLMLIDTIDTQSVELIKWSHPFRVTF